MKYSLITSLTTQHSHSPTRDNHLNKVGIELRDRGIWFGLAVSFPLNFNKTLMLQNTRSDQNHLRSTKIDPAKKSQHNLPMKVLWNKRERGRKTRGQADRGAGVGKKQAVTLACQLLPTGRRSGSLSLLPLLWASGLKLHRSRGETGAAQI